WVEMRYHEMLFGRVAADARFHGGTASVETPVFELLSLGGENSARGFRGDDGLGRRLWSLQNEVWVPIFPAGASTAVSFLNCNLYLAPFCDVGRLGSASTASREGIAQGLGAGLHLRFQGVALAFDWGIGVGNRSDRHGIVHFNFLLP